MVINSNHILTTDHPFHFGTNGIGSNIVLMIVSGILFLTICILVDHLVFEKLIHRLKVIRKNFPTKNIVDDDVVDETQKIKGMTNSEINEANLTLQGLSKFYGNNLAVNQLYLGVNTSECFGLLVSFNDVIGQFVFFFKANLRVSTGQERRPHLKC